MKSRQSEARGRIALLTPYDGGNLGDSAIQKAILAHLGASGTNLEIYGVTLNPARTSILHQVPCFPLAARSRANYASVTSTDNGGASGNSKLSIRIGLSRLARYLPGTRWIKALTDELTHAAKSYTMLRRVGVLVIAGGGQLDDEWGGSWGHPYALAKWSLLATCSRTPVVFLSVGACLVDAPLTRFFLRIALSLASYRSYRDQGSKELAVGITPRAWGPVVPDLAFSLPHAGSQPRPSGSISGSSIGVSPIAYCHPSLWPTKDAAQFSRYIDELSVFVQGALRAGASVCLFSSSPPDDQIFAEIEKRLDPVADAHAIPRFVSRPVDTVDDLLSMLQQVDVVVASRLHGLLLSFLAGKAAVAISYDRKVQVLMDDLGQSEYCVDIRSFQGEDLLRLVQAVRMRQDEIAGAVASRCREYDLILDRQYRMLSQLANRRFVPHVAGEAYSGKES